MLAFLLLILRRDVQSDVPDTLVSHIQMSSWAEITKAGKGINKWHTSNRKSVYGLANRNAQLSRTILVLKIVVNPVSLLLKPD
jgi:hypothetical protein